MKRLLFAIIGLLFVMGLASAAAINISTANYTGDSFSFNTQDAAPRGLWFNPNGTAMFMCGPSGTARVYEYNFTTAWNVSTAVYSGVSYANIYISQCSFSQDGLHFVSMDNVGNAIHSFTLSQAWNISTLTSEGDYTVSFYGQPIYNNNGTKVYVVTNAGDAVRQYSLSQAYNVSSASYDSVLLDVSAQENALAYGAFFTNDGTQIFVSGATLDQIYQYNLTNAWNLSSAVYTSEFVDTTAQDTFPFGSFIDSTGTRLYVLGITNADVYQYSMPAALSLTLNVTTPNGETTVSPVTIELIAITTGTIDTLNLTVWNSTGTLVYSNTSSASANFTTGTLAQGIYFINATGNLTNGYLATTTQTRNVTIGAGLNVSSVTIYPAVPELSDDLNCSAIATVLLPQDLCYQESANVSTACGGLNTGSYSMTGLWISNSSLMDGDWGTASYTTSPGGNLTSSYKIPFGTIRAILQYQGDAPAPNTTVRRNISIPNECLNGSDLNMIFEGIPNETNYANYSIYCNNVLIENNLVDWNHYGMSEEAIYWEIVQTNTSFLWFRNGSLQNLNGTAICANNTVCWNNQTVTGGLVENDNWTCSARASNGLGNSDWVNSSTVIIDTIFPNINYTSPTPANGANLSTTNLTVNVTCNDTRFNQTTIWFYYQNGTPINNFSSATCPFSASIIVQNGRNYSFNATATDTVGHENRTETRNVSAVMCTNLSDANTWPLGSANVSGSIFLNQNATLCTGSYSFQNSSASALIRLNASGITLDCNGSTLTGSLNASTTFKYAVQSVSQNDTTVKNCNFTNWWAALTLQSENCNSCGERSYRHQVLNNSFYRNVIGVRNFWNHNTTFANNSFTDNYRYGVDYRDFEATWAATVNNGDNNVFTQNTFTRNRVGIGQSEQYSQYSGTRVFNNTFEGNALGLAILKGAAVSVLNSSGNTFRDNLNDHTTEWQGSDEYTTGNLFSFNVSLSLYNGTACTDFTVNNVTALPNWTVAWSNTTSNIVGNLTPAYGGVVILNFNLTGCGEAEVFQRYWISNKTTTMTGYLKQDDTYASHPECYNLSNQGAGINCDTGNFVTEISTEANELVFCTIFLVTGWGNNSNDSTVNKFQRARSSIIVNYSSTHRYQVELGHLDGTYDGVGSYIGGGDIESYATSSSGQWRRDDTQTEVGLFSHNQSFAGMLAFKADNNGPSWLSFYPDNLSTVNLTYISYYSPNVSGVTGDRTQFLQSAKTAFNTRELGVYGNGQTNFTLDGFNASLDYNVSMNGVNCSTTACNVTRAGSVFAFRTTLSGYHLITLTDNSTAPAGCEFPGINNDWLINSTLNCVFINEDFDLGTGRVLIVDSGNISWYNSNLTCEGFYRNDTAPGLMTTVYWGNGSRKIIENG